MHKQCGGMTLIEVLVAFVVLSVTMAVILQIFTGGMRNARLSDGYSRAVFLAESRLAAVGVERPLVLGEDGGQAGQNFKWRVIVVPADDAGAADRQLLPVRLFEVKVLVGWIEDGRDRQIALTTLKLGPRQ